MEFDDSNASPQIFSNHVKTQKSFLSMIPKAEDLDFNRTQIIKANGEVEKLDDEEIGPLFSDDKESINKI